VSPLSTPVAVGQPPTTGVVGGEVVGVAGVVVLVGGFVVVVVVAVGGAVIVVGVVGGGAGRTV
jgi:hypothetical protein